MDKGDKTLDRIKFFMDSPWMDFTAGKLPEPKNIICYLQEKIELLEEQSALSSELKMLSDAAFCAEGALLEEHTENVGRYMFHLGMLVQQYVCPPEEFLFSINENYQKELPLRKKALVQKNLSNFAKVMAEKRWLEDENNSIRLSEMCQEVYAELYEYIDNGNFTKEFSDYFPSRPDSLKKALRDVAPAYASKRGAPKKK